MRKSHITFRIDTVNLEKLKKEAEQKNLSVNVLINQIVDLYASWYAYAPQVGIISVWKDIPIMLLNNQTYSDLEKLAKKIANTKARDTALLMNSEFDFDSMIDLIINWLKVSGFPYKYEKSDSTYKLIMQFDMGKKWSFFIAKCWEEILHMLDEIKLESEITDSSLVVTIKK